MCGCPHIFKYLCTCVYLYVKVINTTGFVIRNGLLWCWKLSGPKVCRVSWQPRPRRPGFSSKAIGQGKSSLAVGRVGPFVLHGPSAEYKRPTHVRDAICFTQHLFKLTPKPSQAHPGQCLTKRWGTPDLTKWTRESNHHEHQFTQKFREKWSLEIFQQLSSRGFLFAKRLQSHRILETFRLILWNRT